MILDKKAACAAVGGLLKAQKGWKQRQCEIECCTGDNCNTYNAFKGNVNKRTFPKAVFHFYIKVKQHHNSNTFVCHIRSCLIKKLGSFSIHQQPLFSML